MSDENNDFGLNGNYGIELLIDMKGCDLGDLSKKKLQRFFVELCDLIKMTRHGEPMFWEDHSDIPHLRGTSAIQFIQTSNIVCHPLPMLKAVYLNIFSCKMFNTDDAVKFCKEFWGAKTESHTIIDRV
jgi:S-adenosylmethionine/arginine decarboxylase-like enzyme